MKSEWSVRGELVLIVVEFGGHGGGSALVVGGVSDCMAARAEDARGSAVLGGGWEHGDGGGD